MAREPVQSYVVAGAPAAGKSVLGAAIARHVRAALLDQDVLTGPLTGVVARLVGTPPGDLDDPRVRAATRTATYDALVATAAGCLAAGVPAVLVAPFTAERADPGAWARLVSRLGAPDGAVLVWATCPPDELRRRMAARGAARDLRKLADFPRFLASAALDAPVVPHRTVDTTLAVADQLASATMEPTTSRSPSC
jgi:predicted kinase